MVVLALVAAGCGERYRYTESAGRQLRVDRFTGRAEVLVKDEAGHHWRAVAEPKEHAVAHADAERVRAEKVAAYKKWQEECRAHQTGPPPRQVDPRDPMDLVMADIRRDMDTTGLGLAPPPLLDDPCSNPYVLP